jgi:hypothetical protein
MGAEVAMVSLIEIFQNQMRVRAAEPEAVDRGASRIRRDVIRPRMRRLRDREL